MREPPRHVVKALRQYDVRTTVVWDREYTGWRLVYNGEPQQFILEHRDGTPMLELVADELLDIVNLCDMYKHFDALDQARLAGKALKEQQRISSRRYVEHTMRPEVQKVVDFRLRGGTAKPFSHIQNNPIAQGA